MQSEITYSFRAKITLLPTKDGGRKKPIFSGYKPAFVFNTQTQYCGEIQLIDKQELNPGETTQVEIKLLPARTLRKNLHINTAFTLVEGHKIIGDGTIIKEVLKKETVA
jgi:elongation factor Tu